MVAEKVPGLEAYMEPVVKLHTRSMGRSPTGKFGFPVPTRFGHLAQDNDWEGSWEVWWTRHMRFVLDREEQVRGAHTPEDRQVRDDFVDKVLPRYLRPLETGPRKLKPCLVHTDLWPGNVRFRCDGQVVVFDANALWGHNEGTPRTQSKSLCVPTVKCDRIQY
jgi:protein-ribulosamine 3-kinase